jgi:hypothetical protein
MKFQILIHIKFNQIENHYNLIYLSAHHLSPPLRKINLEKPMKKKKIFFFSNSYPLSNAAVYTQLE